MGLIESAPDAKQIRVQDTGGLLDRGIAAHGQEQRREQERNTRAAPTNWRMVRPRQILARNRPTNGANAIHQAHKNGVQVLSRSVGWVESRD
ncbi:MAG TPA: hypothetical protein VHG10_10350 [Glycomyces sp.]|nr:hypothetical protein [Glycomyces sp.]